MTTDLKSSLGAALRGASYEDIKDLAVLICHPIRKEMSRSPIWKLEVELAGCVERALYQFARDHARANPPDGAENAPTAAPDRLPDAGEKND